MTEIEDLRETVRILARQIRTDRKAIEACQRYATTLADDVGQWEEQIYRDFRLLEEKALAHQRETMRIFSDIAKAADDLLG